MNTRDCALCGAAIPHERRGDAILCSRRCAAIRAGRNHRLRHPERVKAARDIQNSHSSRRILSRTKSRAKKAGLPFDLTLADIVIPERCPILDIPLRERTGRGGALRDSPSVDRKVPELGYVKGNVGIISHAANWLKSNATLDQLQRLVAYMEADRGR